MTEGEKNGKEMKEHFLFALLKGKGRNGWEGDNFFVLEPEREK